MAVLALPACAPTAPGAAAPAAQATTSAPPAESTAPADDPNEIVVTGKRLPKEEPSDSNDIVVTGRRLPKATPAKVPAAAAPSPHRPPVDTALPVLPIPAWAKRPQAADWNHMTVKALAELGQDLLATNLTDAGEFCPKYNSLPKVERAKVWLTIIAAISLFESSFKPASFFIERFLNSAHTNVISRGLLQISSESANNYGCGITKEADLEDPETNLRCGVRILNRLVSTDHRLHGNTLNRANNETIWHGAARYWSVLRGKRKDATIRANTRAMSQCA